MVGVLAGGMVSGYPLAPCIACAVYSRKVEFLYSLIYQTLDLLHAQNRRHKVSSCGAALVGLQSNSDLALPDPSASKTTRRRERRRTWRMRRMRLRSEWPSVHEWRSTVRQTPCSLRASSEFLLLDDVVKEGRNIDLIERPEDILASAALSAGLQQQQQQQPGSCG